MSCAVCDPDLAPSGPCRGEHHCAVRFGTMHVLLSVFKDDVQIRGCYEVDILAGRAWRYEYPLRMCECGRGAAAYIDTGCFSVALLGTSV